MSCITIKRGDDGFGSQLFSIISGVAYCESNNLEYLHSGIQNIKLVDKNNFQNDEVLIANELINKIVNNLGFKSYNGESCTTKPFLHDVIYNEGVHQYFTDTFLSKLNLSYDYEYPKLYNKEYNNIAIHIRRGDDIIDSDKPFRWIESSVYDNIIQTLNQNIENPHFHIFSWGNPNLSINIPNITYHIVNSGEKFIEHFNCLVHSDILIVGSSTFSISAGFFNKNKVICHNSLCKLDKTPIPKQWVDNYHTLIS